MPIHVPFGAPVRSLGIRISLQVYTERSIWKFSYTQLTQSAATRNMSSCRSITRAWEAPPVLRKANPNSTFWDVPIPYNGRQYALTCISAGIHGRARHTGHVLHRLPRYQKKYPHLARIKVLQQAVMCRWFLGRV